MKAEREAAQQEAIRRQLEDQPKPGLAAKRPKFKLKRSQAAQTRQAEQMLRKEQRRRNKQLSKMKEADVRTYLALSDPDNPVMRAIKFGSDEDLQQMYKADIWEQIRAKHRFFHELQRQSADAGADSDAENQFLNSLNEQEYAEFLRSKPADQSIDKYMKSGLASELLDSATKREKVAYQARELALLEEARATEEHDSLLNSVVTTEEEIRRQFTVFYDPTFREFVEIVGREHNDELPLFSQLYILKEVMQFYQVAHASCFLPAVGANLAAQLAYYLFRNRFMFNRSVKLFSLPRVLLAYVAIHFGVDELAVKRRFMDRYTVNINDLFDQDEPFLFNNEAFCGLIRGMHTSHNHLINPHFDLGAIMAGAGPKSSSAASESAKRRQKKAVETKAPLSQGAVVTYYNKTFNITSRVAANPYQRMIDQYQAIFQEQIDKTKAQVFLRVEGQKLYTQIGLCLELHERLEREKKQEAADGGARSAEDQAQILETKREADKFIDSIIVTLNEDFDEKDVTVEASRRDKYDFVRRMHGEIDPDVADVSGLFEKINENHMKLVEVSTAKAQAVPKPALTLREFNAIRSNFQGTDFERNSILPASAFVTSAVLWFTQRAFAKLKWRL